MLRHLETTTLHAALTAKKMENDNPAFSRVAKTGLSVMAPITTEATR